MDFMDEYWRYINRYEIAQNYAWWTALGLLGATLNRRVMFLHGDIEIHGNIYVLLIGPQGNGKTTANDIARKFFEKTCPQLAIGASTQSAEEIVCEMAKEDFPIDTAEIYSEEREVTKPYAFFINEFKNFIAYAPTRMLNFLGDIYDRNRFKSGTIKRGVEDILNPSLNVLACENPDQLVAFMRNNVMSGGLSRRFVVVNELGYAEARPFIVEDPDREQRILERLRAARTVQGLFKWAESGRKFYEPWYREKQGSLGTITNSIMRGYESTKHIQLFKICMGLDAVSDKPMLLFTDELLQLGLSFLTVIEPNMPMLSQTAGRNELMAPQQQLIEAIRLNGGCMLERDVMTTLQIDLKPFEVLNMLEHLQKTEQLKKIQIGVPNSKGELIVRWVYLTPEAYDKYKAEGKVVVKKC